MNYEQIDQIPQKPIINSKIEASSDTNKLINSLSLSTEDFTSTLNWKEIRELERNNIDKFEYLKENELESFNTLTEEIRILYSKVKAYSGKKSDLDEIYLIYKNSNYKDLLIFSSYRAIKYAILELSDPDITHLFIVRIGVKLYGEAYNCILNEYMLSLHDIDFLNCDDEELNIYNTMFDLLVNYGHCNINSAERNNDNTPLHIAVKLKQYHFIIFLLKSKCLTFYSNSMGLTALDYAIYLAYDDTSPCLKEDKIIYEKIVDLLLSFGAERRVYIK